ncbi:MAG TPA: hypothetical protein VLE73_03080 [Candidatus Saccharimonadales bacterium]|nr:hypothetical protein [Candidatus Saccharimonadales bacterium]
MENEHLPSLLGLRVRRNPDDGAKPGYGIYRGVTFCRSLPLHKGPNTNVWDCSIQEPVRDDSNATYHATTLGIGDDGKATLDRTWYFVDPHDTNPDDPGKKVQEQRYGDASAKEYQEYWGYMRDGLLNVIQTAPTAQELFLAEKNIDPVPMRFAALGSITSKAVLVYL